MKVSTKRKAYGTSRADQSSRHVRGHRGTPFSTCVSAGATLLEDQG